MRIDQATMWGACNAAHSIHTVTQYGAIPAAGPASSFDSSKAATEEGAWKRTLATPAWQAF
jgi:hypothetical protein